MNNQSLKDEYIKLYFEYGCQQCSNLVYKKIKYFCILCKKELCSNCCIITDNINTTNKIISICTICYDIYNKHKNIYFYKNYIMLKNCEYINKNIAYIILSYI